MPMGHRKAPFSGKKKKEQLKGKRNAGTSAGNDPKQQEQESSDEAEEATLVSDAKVVQKPSNLAKAAFAVDNPKKCRGRYALKFREETSEEVDRGRNEAHQTITKQPPEALQYEVEDCFLPDLEFPTRPEWSYSMSMEELDKNERTYFEEYLNKISDTFSIRDISFFELNLETWRQLWRVLEISNLVLFVVDVRFPVLLFPPKMYDYVHNKLKKQIIVVINKIDLAPPGLVAAWKHYLEDKFPGLKVALFSCSRKSSLGNKKLRKEVLDLRGAKGALEVCKLCQELCLEYDFSDWRAKLERTIGTDGDAPGADDDKAQGIFTIGCVGQPNVGKSSLINCLMGKKVVSVSKTPGHTKHFQTIFLASGLRLCDCPGLIFPSKIPKSLQVLCGSFPIAQLKDPYGAVKYLAERLDLPKLLGLAHPEGESEWSAVDVANGWSLKRGYYTAKASRLDSYRGANQLLRLALEGKICLNLVPPGYLGNEERWQKHEDVDRVKEMLDLGHVEAEEYDASDRKFLEDVGDDFGDEGSELDSDEEETRPKTITLAAPAQSGRRISVSMNPNLNKFAALREEDD